MRFLTTLALAGLLAACNLGTTTPSQVTLPSTVESSDMAAACADAFAELDVDAIAAAGSLDAVTDELDATLSSCGTVEDWVAAAEVALPTIDMTEVETFIEARCAENSTLAATAICTEVGT